MCIIVISLKDSEKMQTAKKSQVTETQVWKNVEKKRPNYVQYFKNQKDHHTQKQASLYIIIPSNGSCKNKIWLEDNEMNDEDFPLILNVKKKYL